MAAPAPYEDEPAVPLLLHLSARGLLDLDRFSKSDPMVVVQMQTQAPTVYAEWVEVGRTEVVADELDPRFARSIAVEYRFERVQKIRFMVVDVDNEKDQWQKQDFIGSLETTLAAIVGARGGCLTKPLENKELDAKKKKKVNVGTISVTAEERGESRVQIKMRFSARHVDKKDFFGKSDPFLVIMKASEGIEPWIKVHQTEVVKSTLDPVWRVIEISAAKLNGGDMNRPLRFEVYDWDKNSSPDFIGAAESSLAALEKKGELPLINPTKQKKKGKRYTDSGLLRCDGVEIRQIHSFVDYVRGGCQLNMIASIDFTASNGRPDTPTSLHYRTPYGQNEYETAIVAVGNILASYDYDGKFPVYGFGAKLPQSGNYVSHLFALNGNQFSPEVVGVQGILDAYHQALSAVKLYGPTNFAPTIIAAMEMARQIPMGEGYLVVLILTDGVITDMDNTVDALVEASFLPISVIIIGVGSAEFDAMEVLDADNAKLRSFSGKVAQRDIVQFVPFRQFAQAGGAALAAEVLKELPGQVVEFFTLNGFVPRAPPPAYQP